jgi:hypothetical protein
MRRRLLSRAAEVDIPMNSNDLEKLEQLKTLLSEKNAESKVERLAAALIGRLLGISISVAGSGFQHGGDAGTAGRQGRHLRVECKKYKDTTELDERELLGEIDQAHMRDPALEAWILVATKRVKEQIQEALHKHSEALGITVVVIDWRDAVLGDLAALCCPSPELVTDIFSREAGALAEALVACNGDIGIDTDATVPSAKGPCAHHGDTNINVTGH